MRFGARLRTVKFKWNLEKFILLLILILVAVPYIFKGYNSFQEWRIKHQAELLVEQVKKENQRIDDLLETYKITTLENSSPCHLSLCPYDLAVPSGIISYMIGESMDKKSGTDMECQKIDNKNIPKENLYNPTTGKFNIDFNQFKPNNLGGPPPPSSSLSSEVKPMNKCDRLNYQEKFLLFEQQVPLIEKMVKENPEDTFVVNFNNTSFSKYLQLKEGEKK